MSIDDYIRISECTSADKTMNGKTLEGVTSFEHLGTSQCNYGTYSAEVTFRIASAMAAMTRLNRIWRSNTISFTSTFKLYKSLVTSILLHGCETWTLPADSEESFREHVLEETSPQLLLGARDKRLVWSKISFLVSQKKPLLATVKRRTLAKFGHVTRHDSLSKIILQGSLNDGRRRGWRKKCWMENTKEWIFLPMPELLTVASPTKADNGPPPPYPDDPIGQGTELNLNGYKSCIIRI